mmetsp:Transcript_20621/g.41133  ORF Transcript_20621/g.41133 Transcript_20621/m.41133 type:complete len:189 (+) Transcript_20621:562-1128(+)
MKPFLKGFHLSLEMWRGNRDEEGWKLSNRLHSIRGEESEDTVAHEDEDEEYVDTDEVMLDQKFDEAYLSDGDTATTDTDLTPVEEEDGNVEVLRAPVSGETTPAKRFVDDLRALMNISNSDAPLVRVVRSKTGIAAVYAFGDASGRGLEFVEEGSMLMGFGSLCMRRRIRLICGAHHWLWLMLRWRNC